MPMPRAIWTRRMPIGRGWWIKKENNLPFFESIVTGKIWRRPSKSSQS
jgi:hypothetical protein